MKTLWYVVRLSVVWMKSCWDFNFMEAQFCSRSHSDVRILDLHLVYGF